MYLEDQNHFISVRASRNEDGTPYVSVLIINKKNNFVVYNGYLSMESFFDSVSDIFMEDYRGMCNECDCLASIDEDVIIVSCTALIDGIAVGGEEYEFRLEDVAKYIFGVNDLFNVQEYFKGAAIVCN